MSRDLERTRTEYACAALLKEGGAGFVRPTIQPRHIAASAAVALLMLGVACAMSAEVPAIALEECRLSGGAGSGSVAARCGTLEVPEDRAAPKGRKLGLHVAVIPALRTSAEPDALFILSGGPGQAASDFYLAMAPAFSRIRRDRDIVVVDQRGTGRSDKLDCPLPDDADFTEVDAALVKTLAKQCIDALAGDPRLYTTSLAVRDLEEVRAALGYSQVNLYGVSYGTRVAQHYLRRYPNRVRTMVLDGVVPPDLALGPRIPIDAQRALDALFDRCANEAACQKAFPQLRESFAQLRTRLQEAPLEVTLAHPITAAPVDVRLGIPELNAAVRLLSYSDESASILPLLIHEAQERSRPEVFAAQYEMIKRSMQEQLAYGMHFSVICSEDAPRWKESDLDNEQLAATYMGTHFMAAMQAVCDVWPRGPVDDDFYELVRSEVPTLVLSGENDPVTPPVYGERVMPGLDNALHLALSGQGHGQLSSGCMPRIVANFIASASVISLEAECSKSISPTPFMISTTGPSP